MAQTPEGKVKSKIKAVFETYGIYYCMPVGGSLGRSGIPDFIACVNGQFLAVEAKAGNKWATELQAYELDNIAKAGGHALVVNDDTFPQFEATVKTLLELDGIY